MTDPNRIVDQSSTKNRDVADPATTKFAGEIAIVDYSMSVHESGRHELVPGGQPDQSVENGVVMVDSEFGADESFEQPVDPVRAYLNEIDRYSLLTKEQEQELGTRIQAGYQAMKELEKLLNGNDQEAAEDEQRRLEAVIEEGKLAEVDLIQGNLRWVVIRAKLKRSKTRNMPFLDLIQAGNTGLMRAAQKFDPTRGLRFTTYSTWWIDVRMDEAIREDRNIYIPRVPYLNVKKVKAVQRALKIDLGREASPEEIAGELGMDVELVIQAIMDDSHEPNKSLDDRVRPGEDTTLLDMLAAQSDSGEDEPDERGERIKRALAAALRDHPAISPRNREIFMDYHGFDGVQVSVSELSLRHGINPSSVSAALRKVVKLLQAQHAQVFAAIEAGNTLEGGM